MNLKICRLCKEEKETSQFHKCSRHKAGYNSYCKICQNRKTRERYKNNLVLYEIEKKRQLIKQRKKYGIPLDLKVGDARKTSLTCRHYDGNGYAIISRKGHPNARKDHRIKEHIWVMSEHLGRPIRKGETIHHINGIRDDNRIENLELWSTKHCAGQRVEDRIKFYIEFLNEYGYNVTKR